MKADAHTNEERRGPGSGDTVTDRSGVEGRLEIREDEKNWQDLIFDCYIFWLLEGKFPVSPFFKPYNIWLI